MVATIAAKKKSREQQKQPVKQENNIGKFFSTLFVQLLTIIIVIFFGSNFSFAVNNYITEDYLQTDPNKEPYKQSTINNTPIKDKKISWFYRKDIINPRDSDITNMFKYIRNWVSDILIYSWSKCRYLIKESFSEIDLMRTSLKKHLAKDTTVSKSLRYIIDAGLVFLGPIGIFLGASLFFIIGLILPVIGGIKSVAGVCKKKHKNGGGGFHWYYIFLPWMWIIYGLKFIFHLESDVINEITSRDSKYTTHIEQDKGCVGFITSIFLKIAAFFTSIHIFSPTIGPLQAFYFVWKTAITPIFNSPTGYYKGIVQKYKHIIFVLFLMSILSSAWASLNTLTATGITIGAVISAGSWIYSTYGK